MNFHRTRRHTCSGNAVIDAIDAAQQSRLSTARGSNECGDFIGRDFHVYVKKRLLGAIRKAQVFNLDRVIHVKRKNLPFEFRAHFGTQDHRTNREDGDEKEEDKHRAILGLLGVFRVRNPCGQGVDVIGQCLHL